MGPPISAGGLAMITVCSNPLCKWCDLPVTHGLVFVLGEPMHEACEVAFRAEYDAVAEGSIGIKIPEPDATHSLDAEVTIPF